MAGCFWFLLQFSSTTVNDNRPMRLFEMVAVVKTAELSDCVEGSCELYRNVEQSRGAASAGIK